MPTKRPRYLPGIVLPPYTYVPGRSPHPVSDPVGHMHGAAQDVPQRPDPETWDRSAEYLRAVDLFNHGYYWEAHEAWEQLWMAAGRQGVVADFLKGLIKLAAAGVKVREGNAAGARRHVARARQLFQQTIMARDESHERYFGLTLQQLLEWSQQPPSCDVPATDGTAIPVFNFVLTPES
jgi:uncharacterized protein